MSDENKKVLEDKELKEVSGGYEMGYYSVDTGDCFKDPKYEWLYKIKETKHNVSGSTNVSFDMLHGDGRLFNHDRQPITFFDGKIFVGNNVF